MNDWIDVKTARILCPICAKPDWCMVKRDGAAALCNRVESGQPAKGGGWIHDLGESRNVEIPKYVKRPAPVPDRIDWDALVDRGTSNVGDYLRVAPSALGVTAAALVMLDMGWSTRFAAASFPMRGATGRINGIRLRRPDGRKFAVRGSHDGLFYPTGLIEWLRTEDEPDFWLPEGPTDTAALWSIGVVAIGRPSCRGGVRIILEIIDSLPRRPVVAIPADYDVEHGAGEKGAESLANAIGHKCADVRIVTPPGNMKDMRQWIMQSGANHQSIAYLRRAARPWRAA